MEDLVSIIIPINNGEQYLDRCLISVVSQSYSNLEIILVNDGSKDKSLEICNKWVNIDERIKVINNNNEGISKAKNIGIKESKGKYISFVKSKDYLHVDFIKILYNELIRNSADISVCDIYKTNKTNPINIKTEIKEEKIVHSKDILKDKSLVDNNIFNKLYKKSIFLDIKFQGEKQYEDIGVFNKVLYYSSRIVKVESKLYFMLEDDMLNSFSEKQLRKLYIKYYRYVISKVEMNFIYKIRYILYRFIPKSYIIISNSK